MFDEEPIHVHHPQRAVGTSADLHRAKPVVSRGEELGVLFIGRTLAGEGDTLGFKHFAMHQVVDRLADEGVAVISCAEEFIAIDAKPARGGDVVQLVGFVEALQSAADGENAI